MFNTINKIAQLSFAVIAFLSIIITTPAYAQTFNTIPSTSPTFDLDLTVCFKTFDWETFLVDRNAGRNNTNPYDPLTCGPNNTVRLESILANGFTRYNQAQIATPAAKQTFGDDPILGIFNNAGYQAQQLGVGSPAVTQRNSAAALSNIFTAEQLNQIYSTGGARTAMPRIFSTAWVDANNDGQNDRDVYANLRQFISRASGRRVNFSTCATQNAQGVFVFDDSKCTKQDTNLNACITNGKFDATLCEGVYQGGYCEVVNGQIRVRTKRAGFDYNVPADRNPATPLTSCARTVNGNRLPQVENRNLQVYQFIYEFQYPTAQQCGRIPPSGVDYNSCIEFYQLRYGRDLAGNTNLLTGSRTLSTFTFYGTFDDKYSRWVGWRNPDIDIDSRTQSADNLLRGYRGFSVYEF